MNFHFGQVTTLHRTYAYRQMLIAGDWRLETEHFFLEIEGTN